MSKKDRRVLILLAEGKRNKDIANEMLVGVRAIDLRLQSLFDRFALWDENRNRTILCLEAQHYGFLPGAARRE